ncbi:hypothetical protein ACN28S_09680 [Cystobacter fuscus]
MALPRVFKGLSITLQLTLGSGLLGIALGLLVSLAHLSRMRGSEAPPASTSPSFAALPCCCRFCSSSSPCR